ncbi:MAG: FkbM family methyltransferase [Gemmatimonadota bacterium]
MLWHISRIYARAYGWVKDTTGRNLKGLGFLLRRIKRDREFEACGLRWFFDHRIGGSYMRLVGGSHNEPETQSMLRFVADRSAAPLTFIDVGANIGEMVVAMAAHPKVKRVMGFEPHPICVNVCRKNLALNALHGELRNVLVGDGSAQPYVIDARYAPTSGIRHDVAHAPRRPTVTLDHELHISGNAILLIDVEGAELDVMMGGQQFIREWRPLVIFEYNADNRRRYSLDQVAAVLGAGFTILRLRLDGKLDRNLEDTWNCVAVHGDSSFAPIVEMLAVRA